MPKAEYKTIREKVAYAPTKKFSYNYHPAIRSINKDRLSQEIADTLTVLELAGRSFVDPKELPWTDVIWAATMATRAVVPYQDHDNDPRYIYWQGPEFVSIYKAVDGNYIYLEEHIEESIKRLFGEDYLITHRTGYQISYHEFEGVYCTPAMGLPTGLAVAVLDYRVDWDMVVATVSYARKWDDLLSIDMDYLPNDCDREHYMRNLAPRYLAVFGRNDDGSLYIRSHHKL